VVGQWIDLPFARGRGLGNVYREKACWKCLQGSGVWGMFTKWGMFTGGRGVGNVYRRQ